MAFGIIGLVLGLISFFFLNPFGLISVAGMVLSILGYNKKGHGFSLAGIAFNSIAILAIIVELARIM